MAGSVARSASLNKSFTNSKEQTDEQINASVPWLHHAEHTSHHTIKSHSYSITLSCVPSSQVNINHNYRFKAITQKYPSQ